MLDALAAAGVRATFFVLGERVAAHPELLRRVIAAGHDVEVHGYGHLRHPDCRATQVEAGPRRGAGGARDARRRRRRWWRVPWGHLADFTAELAAERGLRLAGWTLDTHDWRGRQRRARCSSAAGARRTAGSCSRTTASATGRGATTAQATAALIGPLVAQARASRGSSPGPLTPRLAGADPARESRVAIAGVAHARVTAVAVA